MKYHLVFFSGDLRYDGRVCALIKTLASSFPNDTILIYNLYDKDYDICIADNVRYKRFKSILNLFPRLHFLQILKAGEFFLFSLFVAIIKRPISIQTHYEVITPGPVVYKMLFPKTLLVYDDKELYMVKDNNITPFVAGLENKILKKADLVIVANKDRQDALSEVLGISPKNSVVVDNYVFDGQDERLPVDLIAKINLLKENNRKIMLHQGSLEDGRGKKFLPQIIQSLPNDWCFVFIGITEEMFIQFKHSLSEDLYSKVYNFGYIPYSLLNAFWAYIDATVIMYGSDTFNNKYCAPNRLYSAANRGVALISNQDNVTLSNFIKHYNTGILIPPMDNLQMFFDDFPSYKQNAMRLCNLFYYPNGIIPQLLEFYSKK